jgi:hypothetical protein
LTSQLITPAGLPQIVVSGKGGINTFGLDNHHNITAWDLPPACCGIRRASHTALFPEAAAVSSLSHIPTLISVPWGLI